MMISQLRSVATGLTTAELPSSLLEAHLRTEPGFPHNKKIQATLFAIP